MAPFNNHISLHNCCSIWYHFRHLTLKNIVTLKCKLGSLKVTGHGTVRQTAYNFLLAFHSNCGPILYHFRDIQR